MNTSALLDVRKLTTRFYSDGATIHAVNGISFSLQSSESMAIVGESGSGKSVSMMSLMRLIRAPIGKIEAGEAWFEGRDLLALSEEEMRSMRGQRIAMIFQDPMTALNPVLTIALQMTEMIMPHLKLNETFAQPNQCCQNRFINEERRQGSKNGMESPESTEFCG